jgi:hypothetical protein
VRRGVGGAASTTDSGWDQSRQAKEELMMRRRTGEREEDGSVIERSNMTDRGKQCWLQLKRPQAKQALMVPTRVLVE